MRIQNTNIANATFNQIKIGSVFGFGSDARIYMRIETITRYEQVAAADWGDVEYNAVCLNDGSIEWFDDDNRVCSLPSAVLSY